MGNLDAVDILAIIWGISIVLAAVGILLVVYRENPPANPPIERDYFHD